MKAQRNETLYVYQVWYETSIGPTFASEKEAEIWLDSLDHGYEDWRESNEMTGYPEIEEILVGDTGWWRDR